MKLTDLQRRFAHEYVIDFKAGDAWARAGGAKKSAYTLGPATLRKPHVRAYVDEVLREHELLIHDHAVMVQRVVLDRALVDPGDALDEKGAFLPLKSMSPALRRAIKSYRVVYTDKVQLRDDGAKIVERVLMAAELDMHDMLPAAQLALKLMGKLKDVVKHEGLNLEQLVLEAHREMKEEEAAKS